MKSTVLIRPMFTRLSFPMSLVRQGSESSDLDGDAITFETTADTDGDGIVFDPNEFE